ncbi:MAG: hypothetical protein J6T10_04995 [Methanobrevibacter sp.]|nr:hypothetical protein [Methanobrevibacter sp.]
MKEFEKTTLKVDQNPIYTFSAESARIHLSLGNEKIGKMINWSTLPGNSSTPLEAKGRRITDVEGTCSHNCTGCFKSCYARRSIVQHHNSITQSWAENTLMIRFKLEECFKQIDMQIRNINKRFYQTKNPADLSYKFFRIDTSGELQSLEELEHWNQLALSHPEMRFGIYSKNSPVLLAFFRKHKQSAPNLCINISEWNGCMKDTIAELRKMNAVFNVFEFDSSNLKTSKMSDEEKKARAACIRCPAVGATKDNKHPINPKTGKTWHCTECQGCYTKTGIHRFVYAH